MFPCHIDVIAWFLVRQQSCSDMPYTFKRNNHALIMLHTSEIKVNGLKFHTGQFQLSTICSMLLVGALCRNYIVHFKTLKTTVKL